MEQVPDVRIKQGNIWFNANEMQTKAYQNYKKRYIEHPLTTTFHIYGDGTYYEVIESQIPTSVISTDITVPPASITSPASATTNALDIVKMVSIKISRTNNNCYMPTYITEKIINYTPSQEMQQNDDYGIIDWNDIKLFLTNTFSQANWVSARPYQAWAYIDYMYNNVEIKYYASRGSYVLDDEDDINNNQIRTYTIIDIDNVGPNIIFSIKRNDNRSVSFVRENNQNVRICDDERARAGYRGYYTRMTMDVGVIISPPSNPHHPHPHHIIPSNIIAIETDIEDEQCILCCKYKKNILFTPCKHNIICSCCYIKLDKGGRECPMCKGVIDNLQCI
jgi:hypothetical protein